jgi:uncharacterized protein (DUF302 family)
VKTIVVPEMNLGQLVHVVSASTPCRVVAYNQMDGTVIYPSAIAEEVRKACS